MLTRLFFYLGIIMIVLSLCALLLVYLFLQSPEPVELGQLIVGNPVDTSTQPELVDEAAFFITGLIQAAEAASTQADLDQVIEKAEAQADLISTAATDQQQSALAAAIETASARLEAAAATPTLLPTASPTMTPTPTGTAPATPTNMPTPTPSETSVPPDTLPVTGSVRPQVVPTVVIEVNWPKKMPFNQDRTINIILTQMTEGEYQLSMQPDTSEVITATPVPIPNSTPQVPIQNAYGDSYSSYAVAEIQIDQEAFSVTAPREVRASLDSPKITWEWLLKPKVPGTHDAIVRIFVEWDPLNSDEKKPAPFELFEERITIAVAPPPLIERGTVTASGVFMAILGTILSLVSKVVENRMKKTKPTEEALS